MLNWYRKEPEKTNYGKIIAITLAIVGGVSAVAYVLCRLFAKYFCLDDCCDDDCLIDEDDGECEVCLENDDDDKACDEPDTAEDTDKEEDTAK